MKALILLVTDLHFIVMTGSISHLRMICDLTSPHSGDCLPVPVGSET